MAKNKKSNTGALHTILAKLQAKSINYFSNQLRSMDIHTKVIKKTSKLFNFLKISYCIPWSLSRQILRIPTAFMLIKSCIWQINFRYQEKYARKYKILQLTRTRLYVCPMKHMYICSKSHTILPLFYNCAHLPAKRRREREKPNSIKTDFFNILVFP